MGALREFVNIPSSIEFDDYASATRKDVRETKEEIRDLREYLERKERLEKLKDLTKTWEGAILKPSIKNLSLSKAQKMRLFSFFIVTIISGVLVTLISVNFINNTDDKYALIPLFIAFFGTSISIFWALMRGKKYDIR